ncbi:DUF4402 domain-containing protein [Balneola sp. MJW-20]|uniref:DUF4402 domain-containing protein n=1 Tax=Gracilimonas aurantiaca TaxID=3234185 RepID=UPI0034654E66
MFAIEIKKPLIIYIMKKLLSTFVFALLLSGATFAQTTISASAEVVADLAVVERQAINFGLLPQNIATAPTIATDGTRTGDVAGGTSTVGLVEVLGTPGINVDVLVSAPFNLDDGLGNTLAFAPNYNVTNEDLDAGNPTPTITDTQADFSFTLDGTGGESTIIIGGQITTAGPVTPGSYTGTSSITVSYQ